MQDTKPIEPDNPTEAERIAYDAYFDECERANKIPLTFDNWRNQNKR